MNEQWHTLEERIARAVRETGLSYFQSVPASGNLEGLRVTVLDSVPQGRRTVFRCRLTLPMGDGEGGSGEYSEEMLFEVQDGFLRRVGDFC